jgi:hypothetical protein
MCHLFFGLLALLVPKLFQAKHFQELLQPQKIIQLTFIVWHVKMITFGWPEFI